MLIQKEIGKVFVELRQGAGKSRADIARETGLSYRYLQRLEEGRYMPSLGTLMLIAAALDTTPDSLVNPVWDAWVQAGQPEIKVDSSVDE